MYCTQGLLVLTAPPEDLPGMYLHAGSVIDVQNLEEVLKKRYGSEHDWGHVLNGYHYHMRPGDWMEIKKPFSMDPESPKVLGWMIGLGMKVA